MRAHPALTDEHEALRDTMRRIVQREIAPHAAAWDEAAEFPRDRGAEEITKIHAARRLGW